MGHGTTQHHNLATKLNVALGREHVSYQQIKNGRQDNLVEW